MAIEEHWVLFNVVLDTIFARGRQKITRTDNEYYLNFSFIETSIISSAATLLCAWERRIEKDN